MRSARKILAFVLLLCALFSTQAAKAVVNNVNDLRHSINISFPENVAPSTSRYNLVAEYDSGDLMFNISTLREGSTDHSAQLKAVPFYNNSERYWSSSIHLAAYYPDGQESRIFRFEMTDLIRQLNNYGPGPCEKMNSLGNEVVCRFNFSVAHRWIPLFVSIKNPNQEQASLKVLGTISQNRKETPEFSWSRYWRVNKLIKKANLRILYNEPKPIMELRWNGSISGSETFKKLKPTKISFQSEKYNTTTNWQGSTSLQPTSYVFFNSYIFSEKDCQVWCDITLILTDPESPGSFYPVQILKYRNPKTMTNFLIVGGFIAFACLVVFVCWITRKRRRTKRNLAEMSQFTEISKVPATHYVVYHAAQVPMQPFGYPAQKVVLGNPFVKK